MKHSYPAILRPEDGAYVVLFPDIGRGATQGNSLPDALHMAADWLAGTLCDIENEKKALPAPSPPDSIERRPGDIVTLVYADTAAYRKVLGSEPAHVVVTLPRWIVTIADIDGVDLSQALEETLRAKLNLEGHGLRDAG